MLPNSLTFRYLFPSLMNKEPYLDMNCFANRFTVTARKFNTWIMILPLPSPPTTGETSFSIGMKTTRTLWRLKMRTDTNTNVITPQTVTMHTPVVPKAGSVGSLFKPTNGRSVSTQEEKHGNAWKKFLPSNNKSLNANIKMFPNGRPRSPVFCTR